MIPRRWITTQLADEYRRGVIHGVNSTKPKPNKWTKGHIVIGFVMGEKADELFRAQDELVAFVHSLRSVRCKTLGVDLASKEVFCDLSTTMPLEDLLREMETACPSLAKGSASAGRFVRRLA